MNCAGALAVALRDGVTTGGETPVGAVGLGTAGGGRVSIMMPDVGYGGSDDAGDWTPPMGVLIDETSDEAGGRTPPIGV